MPKNLPDSYVRRQFYVNGLGNRLGDEFVNELNKSNSGVYAILLEMLPDIINTRPLTKRRAKMLEDLGEEIAAYRGTYILRFKNDFEEELDRLIKLEFAANKREFEDVPLYQEIPEQENQDALALLILGNGIYNGRTIDESFETFSEADAGRIKDQAAFGVTQDMTPEEIGRSIVGTKTQRHKDGIVSTSINSARSMARTITTGVSNAARKAWATTTGAQIRRLRGAGKKGSPILLEVYSAILDSRTTFLCSSLSGNTYKVGDGPYPPLHPNCRSTRYPIPYELAHPSTLKIPGVDFSKTARRRIGGKAWDAMTPEQHRAEILEQKKRWLRKNVGRLPEDMDFEPWFNEQPVKFQRDYLGPNRYARWESGDLDIGSFIAPDGSRYTIDELVNKGVL